MKIKQKKNFGGIAAIAVVIATGILGGGYYNFAQQNANKVQEPKASATQQGDFPVQDLRTSIIDESKLEDEIGIIKDSSLGASRSVTTPAFNSAPYAYSHVTDASQRPHNASVMLYMTKASGGGTTCSAGLVSANILVTAAHCFINYDGTNYTKASTVKVVPKQNTLMPQIGAGATYNVSSNVIFFNEDGYKNAIRNEATHYTANQNDVAFVKLDTPLQLEHPEIKPYGLTATTPNSATTKFTYTGYPKITGGYGLMQTVGPATGISMKANQPNIGHYELSVEVGSSGSAVRNADTNEVVGVNIAKMDSISKGVATIFDAAGLARVREVINANAVSGWKDYNGGRYYFESNGSLATGEKVIENRRYRFNATTGRLEADLGPVQTGRVIRRLVDEDGNQIQQDVILNNANYGTNYSTTAPTLPKYIGGTLKQGSPAANGTVNAGETVVIFTYTKKRGSVYRVGKDATSGTVLYREVVLNNAKYDTPYNATANVLPNYTVNGNATATGTVTQDSQEIVFTYTKKRGNVTVQGVDEKGNELYNESVASNQEYGSSYNFTPKDVQYYKVVESKKTAGQINSANEVLVIRYVRKTGVVKIRGVDQNGKEIYLETSKENVQFGENVTVTPKKVEGYTSASADSQKVLVDQDEEIVEFKYTKNPEPAPQVAQNGTSNGNVSGTTTVTGSGIRKQSAVQAPNTGVGGDENEQTGVIVSIIASVSSLLAGIAIFTIKKIATRRVKY